MRGVDGQDARPWKFAGRLNGQNMAGNGVGGGGVSRNGYTPKDIRFTTNGDTLYAMVMKWPDDQSVTITSLATSQPVKGKVGKVELLGHGEPSNSRRMPKD